MSWTIFLEDTRGKMETWPNIEVKQEIYRYCVENVEFSDFFEKSITFYFYACIIQEMYIIISEQG